MSAVEQEKPVSSPCISVCALDNNDVCTGCYRNLREISDWSAMSNAQRREVILLAHQRCKAYYG
ncbi:MAG: DUF1289 domain-containing protein [Spongiibacter sp.]|uniref:DUF1289 domain-containing protein n=1 Tax=Spongiibacter thalassae TaxID=2721624 RepID=A0ABX1GCK8_9GAMM|nr:DUF1289 domain-containing protein [Spongiibacter thalassae]MDX1504675.1 DUF1289 domain-containing protein [Spongiibacter sp.]NKI16909.1 DUF1289 domain-containing protein [Spongiibacter thalassae]